MIPQLLRLLHGLVFAASDLLGVQHVVLEFGLQGQELRLEKEKLGGEFVGVKEREKEVEGKGATKGWEKKGKMEKI